LKISKDKVVLTCKLYKKKPKKLIRKFQQDADFHFLCFFTLQNQPTPRLFYLLSYKTVNCFFNPVLHLGFELLKPLTKYTQYIDEQLVELLRASDEAAFEEIYSRYWNKLYSFAVAKSFGNESDAQEIVQDVFINFWKRRASVDLQYSLYTYLASAVRYELLKKFATEKKEKQFKKNLSRRFVDIVEAEYLHDIQNLQEHVQVIIDNLPEKTKLVFKLSRDGDLSHKQIASKLKVSEKAIEGHITLALRRLRAGLGSSFIIYHIFF
jgi:RNA polymerase sigma-70 factor (family 1)